MAQFSKISRHFHRVVGPFTSPNQIFRDCEMCGKELRKYVESTAIIIFFVHFPTKYTIFLFVECAAVMEILLT